MLLASNKICRWKCILWFLHLSGKLWHKYSLLLAVPRILQFHLLCIVPLNHPQRPIWDYSLLRFRASKKECWLVYLWFLYRLIDDVWLLSRNAFRTSTGDLPNSTTELLFLTSSFQISKCPFVLFLVCCLWIYLRENFVVISEPFFLICWIYQLSISLFVCSSHI
jgi:hypothetical protein